MADVLEQLSSVLGRPVQAVPKPTPQKADAPSPAADTSDYMVDPKPKGLISPGNLKIWTRPTVQNADGKHSTEYSISNADEHGHEVLIPTIVNGKFLTPDGKKPKEGSPEEKAMFKRAWGHYEETGENLGKFDNPANADAYAGNLHNRGERPVQKPKQSLDEVLGRKVETKKLDPVVATRLTTWQNAQKNGYDAQGAIKAAMTSSAGITAAPPKTTWQSLKKMVNGIPVGSTKTLGSVSDEAQGLLEKGWAGANTSAIPEDMQKKASDYLANIDKAHLGKGLVGNFAAGFDQGAVKNLAGQATLANAALLVGTFGESALAQAAAKTGIAGAVPVARTMAKLMQVHFSAQMLEGAATGAEGAWKSGMQGDWQAAGASAAEGLISGVMARSAVTHEMATAKVQADLENTAQAKHGSSFDSLDPYRQAEVIHDTVEKSSEYKAVLDQENQKELDAKKKAKQNKDLEHYRANALAQAWHPDSVTRSLRDIAADRFDKEEQSVQEGIKKHADTLEGFRQGYIGQIRDLLKTATQQNEAFIKEQRDAEREGRPARKADEAKGKQATREATAATAEVIQKARADAETARSAADTQQAQRSADTTPRRAVQADVDEDGHTSYKANYYGETHSFGVAGDENGNHGVYRETPQGVQHMDEYGLYSEAPENLYLAPDEKTADTVSKLSSLRYESESVANSPESTADQKTEAKYIAGIESKLTSGEINEAEARRQAGLDEKAELPSELDAVKAGKQNGPLTDRTMEEYRAEAEKQYGEAIPDEVLAPMVRMEAENNLHWLTRSGDHVTTKGVTWTLDSKGVLHPSDGSDPVVLMKNGRYSNAALELSKRGSVGFGGMSREGRRTENAKRRKIETMIADIRPAIQESLDWALRVGAQQKDLGLIDTEEPRVDESAKAARRKRFYDTPESTRSADKKSISSIVQMALDSPANAEGVIQSVARETGASPEDVILQAIGKDDSPAGQIAGLTPGDQIKDAFRPGRPWVVTQAGDRLVLRSGSANDIRLDRINPSERVLQLVKAGGVESTNPKFGATDVETVAFKTPHAIWSEKMADQVAEIEKTPLPEPASQKVAEAQQQAAEQRVQATQSIALTKMVEAQNPPAPDANATPEEAVKEPLRKAKEADDAEKVAQAALRQAAAAKAKATKEGQFPELAPISRNIRGNGGIISQNGRDFEMHYEAVPMASLISSHKWEGSALVKNADYPGELQPRTFSMEESRENALRGEQRVVTEDGTSTGYNFAEYGDKTINGTMGPAIVEQGGRVVGGNTRLAIMQRHMEVLSQIANDEERETAQANFRGQMRRLASEVGIRDIPLDDNYVVIRMMDKRIETLREAADLGRLFNKSVSVEMSAATQGVSFSKSLTPDIVGKIGRLIDSHDGFAAATREDPDYFLKVVRDQFGIVASEDQGWFVTNKDGSKVLSERGRERFMKAVMGTAINDTTVLSKIEGSVPYRALERALPYVTKLPSIPDLDISQQINEAVSAASLTVDVPKAILDASLDRWDATYRSAQMDVFGVDDTKPKEPSKVVEAIWRAMHRSTVESPRAFSDRLKNYIGDESLTEQSMFGDTKTPVEIFNDVFRKELAEVAHGRGDKVGDLTQAEWDAARRNQDLSDEEIQDSRAVEKGESVEPEQAEASEKPAGPAIQPPPEKKVVPEATLAADKQEKGYVTAKDLKAFLSEHPSSKDHVTEIMRTAKMMAEYVFDFDPPAGVERTGALDWVLKERVAGLEDAGRSAGRGSYSDANIEKGIATSILKLHNAADETTFIHEFAHVIFPMLGKEDMVDLNTIRDKSGSTWDIQKPLKGDEYKGLSEKFARGLEKFLRDGNPTGFSDGVAKLMEKVKQMFRSAYMKFRGDPLADLRLTAEAKEVFANMFHITENDVMGDWKKEADEARAAERKVIKRPEEALHPTQELAKQLGAQGIRDTFAGKVEDNIGGRVDPKKPTAVLLYPDSEQAVAAWSKIGDEVKSIDNAELLHGDDDTWGIRFNAASKTPRDVLFQEAPRLHPAIEREQLKKKIASATGPLKGFLEKRLQNLENDIRSKAGVEEKAPVDTKEAAKAVLEDKKNGSRSPERSAVSDGPTRTGQQRGIERPPQRSKFSLPEHANPRVAGEPVRGTAQLTGVRSVELEPLARDRGEPVGLREGQKFDAKEWVEGNQRAGLPENLPPPTVTLRQSTADALKFGGQKQVVQTALSALQQGDGVVIATATGSGKSYTGMGIASEWMADNPDAKVLYITKNQSLLRSAAKVSKGTFGFETRRRMPEGGFDKGVHATTYQSMLGNDAYSKQKWDLVIADESGEARNWHRDESKQGKALIDVMANSAKGVYMSATPWHSPMEIGYAEKLGLWPKGGFQDWIKNNFAHEKVGDKVFAKLDPGKQAKLRQQLIERGQFISQNVSYDGFTTHFGVVPVTDEIRWDLNRIHEGISRAKFKLTADGKKGMADRLSAFEATYTKAYLERSRLPQAIQLIKRAREQGWQVAVFSETTAEDLFRRPLTDDDGNVLSEKGAYRKLDDDMGGQLSQIMPPFENVYDSLAKEFGNEIGDYSGSGNTDGAREEAKQAFLKGEKPVLYTTYAAGGVGVSLHDEDGDKPRVSIFLGPPYSGVLLEQSMGRTWRFGVKSDARAVFLATDSEPDVRLMATKVGPRMRALRASVLGTKDSLGTVMGSYSKDEKVREQHDILAYDQGNEVKVDAQSFQRKAGREVSMDNWSSITFPSAETAKNKGMKVEMTGATKDTWATLYQANPRKYTAPPTMAEMAAQRKVNAAAQRIMDLEGVPDSEPLAQMHPTEREAIIGATVASIQENLSNPVERDADGIMRTAMGKLIKDPAVRAQMNFDPDKGTADFANVPEETLEKAVLDSQGGLLPEKKDHDAWAAIAYWNQEQGILSIGRQAKSFPAAREVVTMNRKYRADTGHTAADFQWTAHEIFKDAKVDSEDPKIMAEIWDVVEGRRTSTNPGVNKAAQGLADFHKQGVLQRLADAGVAVKLPNGSGELAYKDFEGRSNHMPRKYDWDLKLVDPLDSSKTHTLREVMGGTFDEAKRRRIIENRLKEQGANTNVVDAMAELTGAKRLSEQILGNIHRTRTKIDLPFYKKDIDTLMRYYEDAAKAIASEDNFGHHLSKLGKAIGGIDSLSGQKHITTMMASQLKPAPDYHTLSGKAYSAGSRFTVGTKMILSATKLPFHFLQAGLTLGGRTMPIVRAGFELALHPRETMERATMIGSVAREINYEGLPERSIRDGFSKAVTGVFTHVLNVARAASGAAARIYLNEYAFNGLKKGGKTAEETRRLIRDTMLIGDHDIDQAIQNGKWQQKDIDRAEVAFTNQSMFDDKNQLQMPVAARANTQWPALNNALRASYALQSFTVKLTSEFREKIWAEAVHHGNLRPLAWALVAEPIIGESMKAITAAMAGGIHRGSQAITGSKHTEDSWDKYREYLKGKIGEGPLGLVELYVDAAAKGAAMDRLQRYGDMMIDLARGDRKAVKQEKSHILTDEIESDVGAIWTSAVHTPYVLADTEIGILAGNADPRKDDKLRDSEKNVMKQITEEVPVLRDAPYLADIAKKKKKTPDVTRY